MNARISAIAVMLLSMVLPGSAAQGAEDPLADTLRQVAQGGLAAYDREDVEGTLGYVHTKSPEYERMKSKLEGQFQEQNLQTSLVEFRYIGHDEEFAVARIKVKTVSETDAGFTDNVVDSIAVFHQEAGVWKLWSDHVLGVEIAE